MLDLGVDLAVVRSWFPHLQETPYVLVRVSAEHAQTWADVLKVPIRRCYITDRLLAESAERNQLAQTEIITAKLPDPGATMSGDFGEIISYLYQGAKQDGAAPLGAVKWRLKQDRTKPAPYSDVVHFLLPSWPTPTADDCVLCAEVKTKATAGNWAPIAKAIEDSKKDRVSRLARTLQWLRERCLTDSVGDISLEQLDRFRKTDQYPPAQKRFSAVTVICGSLADAELLNAPTTASPEYTLVVITVPELQKLYTDLFTTVASEGIEPPVLTV
jgi:hypothetical protein